MWHRWFSKDQPPIGIEFGHSGIRMAQVHASRGQRDLVLRSWPLPSSGSPGQEPEAGQISACIAEAIKSGAFLGGNAVTCLGPGQLTYRTLRLANMADHELQSAAHWKLAAELKLKPDQFSSQLLSSRQVRENGVVKAEVIVVAASADAVRSAADILAAAGLKLDAVDASSAAIVRALAPSMPSALLVEIHERSALLVVIDRGDLQLIRPLGRGADRLQELLSHRLELAPQEGHTLFRSLLKNDDSEWTCTRCTREQAVAALDDGAKMFARELAREISLSLRYYEDTVGGTVPEQGIILGAGLLPAAGHSALAIQTGIAFAPLAELPVPQWQAAAVSAESADPGDWLTAIGLALYAQDSSAAQPRREVA